MKVLVTGSGGFVGRWLMAHLREAGDQAVGLPGPLDITDGSALAKAVVALAPDAICHLAAQASVAASWGDRGRTFEVNALGASNLLEAALGCDSPPRVLIISSAEVYGRVTPADLPLSEDRPLAPASPYAASKAAAEMCAIAAWLGSGLEVVRARPFNHTGPGQRVDFVIPSLARQVALAARRGLPYLEAGNLEARRDITDVRDVVRAYRALLLRGVPGEVYNVCRGSSVAIREVAEGLLRLAGAEVPIKVVPERVRPVDIADLVGDPTRLRNATGWEPEIDLGQTLHDVLASFDQASFDQASVDQD